MEQRPHLQAQSARENEDEGVGRKGEQSGVAASMAELAQDLLKLAVESSGRQPLHPRRCSVSFRQW